MREVQRCEDRLKNIVTIDKQESSQKISRLIKSELFYLLKNYFDICAEDFTLNISVNEKGEFDININALAKTMKIAHIFQ